MLERAEGAMTEQKYEIGEFIAFSFCSLELCYIR